MQLRAGHAAVFFCKRPKQPAAHFASVAQLVEQQTLNLFVHGSSPCRGTNLKPTANTVGFFIFFYCLDFQSFGLKCESSLNFDQHVSTKKVGKTGSI